MGLKKKKKKKKKKDVNCKTGGLKYFHTVNIISWLSSVERNKKEIVERYINNTIYININYIILYTFNIGTIV